MPCNGLVLLRTWMNREARPSLDSPSTIGVIVLHRAAELPAAAIEMRKNSKNGAHFNQVLYGPENICSRMTI